MAPRLDNLVFLLPAAPTDVSDHPVHIVFVNDKDTFGVVAGNVE